MRQSAKQVVVCFLRVPDHIRCLREKSNSSLEQFYPFLPANSKLQNVS